MHGCSKTKAFLRVSAKKAFVRVQAWVGWVRVPGVMISRVQSFVVVNSFVMVNSFVVRVRRVVVERVMVGGVATKVVLKVEVFQFKVVVPGKETTIAES